MHHGPMTRSSSPTAAVSPTASEQITASVTAWPEVTSGFGSRGELAFKLGPRELGHLHGDRVAHFGFPKAVWHELFDAGRITHHPVFPGKAGPGGRQIAGDDDVHDVIALMRVNYDRIMASRERPPAPR
jgi:Family of unknown function (DUF5519)